MEAAGIEASEDDPPLEEFDDPDETEVREVRVVKKEVYEEKEVKEVRVVKREVKLEYQKLEREVRVVKKEVYEEKEVREV